MKKINFKSFKSLVRPKFIWAIIAVLLLVTSASFYLLKENERKLKIFTQKQLIKTIEAKKVVELILTKTLRAKETVEQKFNAEKKRSLALEEEVKEKENRIRLTLGKLENEIVARREAEAWLIVAMKEKRVLEAKVRKFTELPKAIELEKIVVKPAPILAGKVLAANKECAFIVVNLGRDSGLKIGDVLLVYRNDEFIGKAEVERVIEKMLAAAILPEWHDREFKESDEVRKL